MSNRSILPSCADREHEMECLICKITSKQIFSHVVYGDDVLIAILDIGPIRLGQAQIVPKQHFETFDVAPADVAARMMWVGQKLARPLKAIHQIERDGFVCTGGDVPHAHAHIIPLFESTDITSTAYIENGSLIFRLIAEAALSDLQAMSDTIRRHLR